MKKIIPAAVGIGLALGLAACSGGGQTPEEVSSTSSTTLSTSLSTSSESSPEPTMPGAVEEASPTPAVEEPVAQEPHVVECLTGTPGPSLMSDGTTVYTDYCFEVMGGPAYREEESRSGLFHSPGYSYQCPGTDIWVDDSSFCTPEIIGPENVAFHDGGTCPGAICGYGHNQEGQRNPTSGEIQTLHGCQDGYITDPELCSAVAWVEGWQY